MEKSYCGIKMKQRPAEGCPTFFTFYATASEIRSWVAVECTRDKHGASQRMIRESRLNGIRKFLNSDSRNSLPNNILIAFAPGETTYSTAPPPGGSSVANNCNTEIELGTILFKSEEGQPKPALLVDGQHRLYGSEGIDEDIPLLVVAILDSTPEEQAFQFIVINNKSVKVPPQTVKSIVADFDDLEADLIDRLLPAGITYGKQSPFLSMVDQSERSPFHEMLDWDKNRTGEKIISVTTAEGMLSFLNKELAVTVGKDEDSSQQILFWIWEKLKELYSEIWTDRNSQFFSKVNMLALNEYSVNRLRGLASMQMIDIFEEEDVKQTTTRAFMNIPQELWKKDWSGIKIQDNKVIREYLTNTLELVATNCINGKDWSDSLKIFEEK